MKYYGFKFESFVPTSSKINRHVGTWIGVFGTFLFLISSAEHGSFKGSIGVELLFTVFYPGVLWFFSSLAENHRWAKKLIICLSALASILAVFSATMMLIFKQEIVVSVFCFLVLNGGVFILARKKVVSIYK